MFGCSKGGERPQEEERLRRAERGVRRAKGSLQLNTNCTRCLRVWLLLAVACCCCCCCCRRRCRQRAFRSAAGVRHGWGECNRADKQLSGYGKGSIRKKAMMGQQRHRCDGGRASGIFEGRGRGREEERKRGVCGPSILPGCPCLGWGRAGCCCARLLVGRASESK